ncbi:MAG: PEP-CTERM sorting domain-containing protein [Phycisphaerales bacterium]|nr:PEP-CTERM sorting domain-containing protein [Phycisphaerales bacterium]
MRTILSVLSLVTICTTAARADRVAAVDLIFATSNGTPFFGDHFDNGVLEPIWDVVAGSPGPETGTTLDLHGGDLLLAPLSYDPQTDLAVASMLDVSGMQPGDLAAVVLYGANRGDILAFILGNGTAFATDETFAPLGVTSYVGELAVVELNYDADGTFRAIVNGSSAFDGIPGGFGPVSEVGLLAIPEPATVTFMIVGLGLSALRRRRSTNERG